MRWNLHTPSAVPAKDLPVALERARDLYLAASGILDLDLRKSLQAQISTAIESACLLAGMSGHVQVSLSGSVSPTDEGVSSRASVSVDFLSAPSVVDTPPAKPKK